MARAKAQGRHTGRPALSPANRAKVEALLASEPRPSDRAVARAVGVSYQTVSNVRRARV